MTQPLPSALSKQSVHTSRRHDISVGYFVLPGYAQDKADASQVEFVEPALLPGICTPCLATINQGAGNTVSVDCHICLHRQLGACPHSGRETSDSCILFHNPLVDLCVQREVVGEGGAAVGDLADSIEFVVVDGSDRRCFCVLSQDIRLLQKKQSISDWRVPPGCGSQLLRHHQTVCP